MTNDTVARTSKKEVSISAGASELMMELFNRMPVESLKSVPEPIAKRIGDFMVANGYRVVFDRWYLQAEPHAPETFVQPRQTVAEMDLESACNWLACFADSESPIIRTYVRRLMEKLQPRPGTLAARINSPSDGYALKASGCPTHGMEHFFEGMCIECGKVPPVSEDV